MAAGGLRELLMRYGGRVDRPIIATVPVSTDMSAERITGNEIGGLTVSVPVHVDDALERVDLTSLATKRAKEDYDLLGPELQGRMLEYLPPPLAPALFRRQSTHSSHNRLMNVAISNVPGPRERGHIGGAPVSEIYSVGVLSAGSAFNMTVPGVLRGRAAVPRHRPLRNVRRRCRRAAYRQHRLQHDVSRLGSSVIESFDNGLDRQLRHTLNVLPY
jgi:hypothetical protein